MEIETKCYKSELLDAEGEKQIQVQIGETMKAQERNIRIEKKNDKAKTSEIYDSRKPGKIVIKASDASSYYRKGRPSTDPFDRYRNLYLVVENIADKIRMSKGQSKLKEQPLLELALDECFINDTKPLENIYKEISELSDGSDLLKQVSEYLFKAHRCQLNHSKVSEDKKFHLILKTRERL